MENLFKANQIEGTKENKKVGLKEKKDKTMQSLREVEHFLCQTHKALNHIKLYKILK